TGLVGNADPLDRVPRLSRFVTPPVKQLQQGQRLRRQLHPRLSQQSWNQTANQPALAAHLDYRDERAILFKGDEGSAEVIELRHGALLSVRLRNPIDRLLPSPLMPHRIYIRQFGTPLVGSD